MMSDFRRGWGVKQNRTKSDKGGRGSLSQIGHPVFWEVFHKTLKKYIEKNIFFQKCIYHNMYFLLPLKIWNQILITFMTKIENLAIFETFYKTYLYVKGRGGRVWGSKSDILK